MSETSTARKVQRALGVAYSTALMWVRDPANREEAAKARTQDQSYSDALVAVITAKYPPKE